MGNNVPIQHTGNKSFFAHGVHHGTAAEELPSGEVVATTGGQPASTQNTTNTSSSTLQSSQGSLNPAAGATTGAAGSVSSTAPPAAGKGIELDNRDPDGLGLAMTALPRKDGALQVASVAAGGAVDAWNCSQRTPESCLKPGSIITSVNGVSGNTFNIVTALRKNEVLHVVVSNDRQPEPEAPGLTLEFRGRAGIPRKPVSLPSHSAWAADSTWADDWAAAVPQGSDRTSVSVPQSSDPPSSVSERSSTKDKKEKRSIANWPSVSFGGTSNHWPDWAHGSTKS